MQNPDYLLADEHCCFQGSQVYDVAGDDYCSVVKIVFCIANAGAGKSVSKIHKKGEPSIILLSKSYVFA